jgi:hypothetical protein
MDGWMTTWQCMPAPPSCFPAFQYKYSKFFSILHAFSVFFSILVRAPYMTYLSNLPHFSVYIYAQNSVKTLMNPYTWRLCMAARHMYVD